GTSIGCPLTICRLSMFPASLIIAFHRTVPCVGDSVSARTRGFTLWITSFCIVSSGTVMVSGESCATAGIRQQLDNNSAKAHVMRTSIVRAGKSRLPLERWEWEILRGFDALPDKGKLFGTF